MLEIRGRGSWVDYVQTEITKYGLRDVWEEGDWGGMLEKEGEGVCEDGSKTAVARRG